MNRIAIASLLVGVVAGVTATLCIISVSEPTSVEAQGVMKQGTYARSRVFMLPGDAAAANDALSGMSSGNMVTVGSTPEVVISQPGYIVVGWK